MKRRKESEPKKKTGVYIQMKSDLTCVILCQRVYDFKNPILFFLGWFHFPYFIYLLYNVSRPTYFQLLSV